MRSMRWYSTMGLPAVVIVLALVHSSMKNLQTSAAESGARDPSRTAYESTTMNVKELFYRDEAEVLDIDPNLRCASPPPYCTRSKYRSYDGSCNNLDKPYWGMPNTPYDRMVASHYSDGVYNLARSSSGNPLPNTREISLRLFPDVNVVDKKFNVNAQTWGQMITHDMSHTSGVRQFSFLDSKECCDHDGHLVPGYSNKTFCAPILIPPGDPVFPRIGLECLGFARSATTRNQGCPSRAAPADPTSSVTAYMDLSPVYGIRPNQTKDLMLRAYHGGRLLSTKRTGREWPPQSPNVTGLCNQAFTDAEPCYIAGDIRVNQNTQLSVLHVILMREHNRIADTLAELNPHWEDEKLFQETRRIFIAEYQHISFYEYLPILLGYDNMVQNKLIYPHARGYVNDYDPEVNPSVMAEHATAACRHFHTLIVGNIQLISEKRETVGSLRLGAWMNRPLALEQTVDDFDNLIRGLTAQPEGASDQFIDTEMKHFLFRSHNETYGKDLRANDIQRGRDHGLSTYIDMREACGLSVPKTFQDMLEYISEENVALLQDFYETLEDVELIVAGSLEALVPGALAGPTFLCIITQQFYRTRVSDRYFYENGADSDIAFTPRQLETIRKGASIARLLCDNGDHIHEMQPRAFELISHRNKLVPCDRLPAIDLSLWKERSSEYSFKITHWN